MSLWSEFLTNDQRLIHKWVHYFPIYERHFAPYRNRSAVFWEIGCGKGGSLQMWKRWFGPRVTIVGIDIDASCKDFEEHQINVRIGDQSDTKFLQTVLDEFGAPDVVLDDGSHIMSHLSATFRYLYPKTARSGVYLVEDLHTAYWDEYDGGLMRDGSFIENCKWLIDEINAHHTRGAVIPTPFTEQTLSMHIYDSIVVFERGKRVETYAPQIGGGPKS